MDERLAAVPRGPFSDEPRFYPPGKHPATHRLRVQLARLEELGFADHEFAVYVRDEIAKFEEGESEMKQQTLRMLDR